MHRWGATDDEVRAALPGDELTPGARNISTRAITVHAPAHHVWRWLQQIDQQRGGFFSYRALENALGCRMPPPAAGPTGPDRIVGERVWMAPPDRFGGKGNLVVARVDPERALVLLSPDIYAGGPPEVPMSGSWSFVVEPRDRASCRLVVRSRYDRPNLAFDVVHFVMERKMMRTLAHRAETTCHLLTGA